MALIKLSSEGMIFELHALSYQNGKADQQISWYEGQTLFNFCVRVLLMKTQLNRIDDANSKAYYKTQSKTLSHSEVHT